MHTETHILKLYEEAENDINGFKATLPHWHFVESFLRKNSPEVLEEIGDINKHLRVANTTMNGMAFTFHPVYPHRDKTDICPALISYLNGPLNTASWLGGAFLVRMFGLRIPVSPRDQIIFV